MRQVKKKIHLFSHSPTSISGLPTERDVVSIVLRATKLFKHRRRQVYLAMGGAPQYSWAKLWPGGHAPGRPPLTPALYLHMGYAGCVMHSRYVT